MTPLDALVSALHDAASYNAAAEAPPAPLRLYLAEDDHTDYMWTANAATYDRVFVEMIDHHLRLAGPRLLGRDDGRRTCPAACHQIRRRAQDCHYSL